MMWRMRAVSLIIALILSWLFIPVDIRAEEPWLGVEARLLAAGPVPLDEEWRFQVGDDPTWAALHADDSAWRSAPTFFPPGEKPPEDWEGNGWYRVHLRFDEKSLKGRRLALLFNLKAGASEVYLDGERLASLGRVGNSQKETFENRERRIIWLPTSGPSSEHVLAVRYASFRLSDVHAVRHDAGFTAMLAAPEDAVGFEEVPRRLYTEQALFTAIPLAFGILHLLFFLFDRRARENLWLAMVTLALAGVAFCEFREEMPLTTEGLLDLKLAMAFGFFVLTVGTIGFIDALLKRRRLKRRLWEFSFLAALILGAPKLGSVFGSGFVFAFSILVFLALIFELVSSTIRFLRQPHTGAWILGVGLCLLFLGILGDFAIDAGYTETILNTDNPYLIGAMALILSMSIYLARNMTRTRQQLEQRLVQVKELSERALEQEKAAREQEIASRLLEVDHARKTAELAEARDLQLSLLPRVLPSVAGFETAAWMLTATEVGGDFYDARVDADGALIVAVGDAAGHGMRAGILAAVTKGLFDVLTCDGDAAEMLAAFRRAIGGMRLRRLHMSLLLARFKEHRIELAAAGMPSALLFHAADGRLEELIVKGLPLGSTLSSVAEPLRRNLAPGDVVLIASDGFPELRCGEAEGVGDDEELGYEAAHALFRAAARHSPATRTAERILEELKAEVLRRTEGRPPQDDVTLMVVKVR